MVRFKMLQVVNGLEQCENWHDQLSKLKVFQNNTYCGIIVNAFETVTYVKEEPKPVPEPEPECTKQTNQTISVKTD